MEAFRSQGSVALLNQPKELLVSPDKMAPHYANAWGIGIGEHEAVIEFYFDAGNIRTLLNRIVMDKGALVRLAETFGNEAKKISDSEA